MRRIAPVIAVIASLAFAGCSHSTSASPPEAGASAPAGEDDEAAVSLKDHHRHHHNGGVTAFIAMALETLGQDSGKKDAVEKIHADLATHLEPAREAEKQVVTTLADGIAAGKIDNAQVDAAISRLAQAASSAHQAVVTSLNELHALLSPPERAALVDKVQAHWQVWRGVNHEAPPGGREANGRLSHLKDEVDLTPDQLDKISTALKTSLADLHAKFDPSLVESHVQEFSTAFVKDTFDAKSLRYGAGANDTLATHGAKRMAIFYETVTPLLTAEQRTKLAEHLRAHLGHQHVHQA